MKFRRILQYLALFFIGIGNSLPLPIVGSTLSFWLTDAGFDKSTIGLYALLGIPTSLKILWSPLIDRFALPFFKERQRKGWILFALTGMAATLLCMSAVDPAASPWTLAGCIFAISLFTACLYMAGISYELESLETERYPMGSANVIAGYRIGLLCGGGGILFLSTLWDWSAAFRCAALLVSAGAAVVLVLPEPFRSRAIIETKKEQIGRYPSLFSWFWKETIKEPCTAFFRKPGWPLVLTLLLLFKAGDELSKSMEGPFYLSLGFSKYELAMAAKTWGMAATLLGAFAGGWLLKSGGSFATLVRIGCLHASTLYCYWLMSIAGKSMAALCLTVALEHFTAGLLMTAFIAFLWRHCDKQYAAMQYALCWSVVSFKTDVMACLGGFLASYCAWETFFLIVATVGVGAAALPAAFAKMASPEGQRP